MVDPQPYSPATPIGPLHGYRLELGDPTVVPVQVDLSPQPSIVQLLLDAARPAPAGTLALAVRRSLAPSAAFALAALADPRVRAIPDVMLGLPPGERAPVEMQVEALRSTPGEVLVEECNAIWGAEPPAVWRAGVANPERWLTGFADACRVAWEISRPRWRRARPLLRREARRIGLAAVSGQLGAVLGDLHPRLRLDGTALVLGGTCGGRSRLGTRRLVLAPMLTRTRNLIVDVEHPASGYICYSLPHAGPADDRDPLALLLGPVRASLVRFVRRPRTVSQLASHLNCAPSTITYHCDQLVEAGLVRRDRRGAATWISLTQRGVELDELMATDPDL
jgi:DNA-binding transcriptional ArsR family regulator